MSAHGPWIVLPMTVGAIMAMYASFFVVNGQALDLTRQIEELEKWITMHDGVGAGLAS